VSNLICAKNCEKWLRADKVIEIKRAAVFLAHSVIFNLYSKASCNEDAFWRARLQCKYVECKTF